MPTYHFANVVDDHLMKITHVIRGEEWLPSLPLHQLIYDAFGWKAPEFMHLPLILKPQGKGKLSKRDGEKMGFPVFPLMWEGYKGFKERGFLPEALMNYLALLGWNPGTEEEIMNMEKLRKVFDPEKIQKGGAKFDFEKARWINHKFLVSEEEKSVLERFPEFFDGLPNDWSEKKKKSLYELLRDRLFLLEDFKIESQLFWEDPVAYDVRVVDKIKTSNPKLIMEQFINYVHEEIPPAEWKTKIHAWNQTAGFPFDIIMQTLRLALVGSLTGPDLFKVCEVFGKEITLKRLEKFYNHLNS